MPNTSSNFTTKKRDPWDPRVHGVSVSCLNLFLQDRVACDLQYLQGWRVPEPWNERMAYGKLFQAGIEGYVKTGHTKRGAARFLQTEYYKQIDDYGTDKTIAWWSKLALHECYLFIDHYNNPEVYGKLPLTTVTASEENLRVEIALPSKRTIVLNTYIDGQWSDGIMENKCRAKWNEQAIADQIRWDLQYNIYCLAVQATTGKLPDYVWYQHIRKPGGWGYAGPRKKRGQTQEQYLEEIVEHMHNNVDYYFYRFIGRPQPSEIDRFCFGCLYPILEQFLDWYEYMTSPNRYDPNNVNRYHWATPYGQYSPFLQDTAERFRDYRLTGSTVGLIPPSEQ